MNFAEGNVVAMRKKNGAGQDFYTAEFLRFPRNYPGKHGTGKSTTWSQI